MPHRRSLPAIALFARAPVPGQAKTRLIPTLGPAGAARFQAALVADGLAKLGSLRTHAQPYMFVAGAESRGRAVAARPASGEIAVRQQRGAELGARLFDAFLRLLRRYRAVIVIGADSPELAPSTVRLALSELKSCDAVLGPCPDGGYYLIGLRRLARRLPQDLFRGVRWGSRHAFRDTLRNLLDHGWVVSILDPLRDVDRPPDLGRLTRLLRRSAGLRRLSPAVWRFLSQ